MPATSGVMGAVALAFQTVDELILSAARDVHTSISGRVFGLGDRVAGGRTLPHRLHDGIAGAVYGGVGLGLRGSARGLRVADSHRIGPSLESTARGRFVVAAVNGLIGDRLREQMPEMSFEAAVRVDGRDVELTGAGIAAAYPGATGGLVVFVPGLCETEDYWRRPSRPRREPGASAPSYAERLASDLGWTPVHVRVNTGLPLAENGVAVAALLTRLVEGWPVEVDRIALVGHSLGGLVLRAACAVSDETGVQSPPWTDLVTDLVTLGTPHLGAPLERVVARGTGLLGRIPEAAPIGRILEYRSVGILDLRHGLARDIRNLPHAKYHLVAGSLTASPRHPVALGIGDLLVQPRSAFGRPRDGAEMFPDADTLHVPGADHFDLLNHDDVYAALRRWLGPAAAQHPREDSHEQ